MSNIFFISCLNSDIFKFIKFQLQFCIFQKNLLFTYKKTNFTNCQKECFLIDLSKIGETLLLFLIKELAKN